MSKTKEPRGCSLRPKAPARSSRLGDGTIAPDGTVYDVRKSPIISADSGVLQGQLTEGGKWKFSFFDFDEKAPGHVIDDTVINAILDGVTISALIPAGSTTQQAAAALYFALVGAGVSDAELVGSSVLFLTNTRGAETIRAALEFSEASKGGFGLVYAIDIAERNIL